MPDGTADPLLDPLAGVMPASGLQTLSQGDRRQARGLES
jgi:hypothetical protein